MRLKKDLFAAKSDLADKLCQLDDTEVKLREKTAEHVQACKVVEKLCKTIPELEKEISRLKRNSVSILDFCDFAVWILSLLFSIFFFVESRP